MREREKRVAETRRYALINDDTIRGTATSFFFTNFPEHWSVARLGEAFSKLGRVADVFVAKKRSSQGRKFGFVRFFKVTCMEKMIDELNKLWLDKFRIRANVAKYRRKETKPTSVVTKGRLKSIIVKDKNTGSSSSESPMVPQLKENPSCEQRRSYVEAVKGISTSNQEGNSRMEKVKREMEENVIQVITTPEDKERMGRTLIGEVQSLELLRNFQEFTKVEGIDNVHVSFIGGLGVSLEFRSKVAVGKYLKKAKDTWSSWFRKLQLWEPESQNQKRLVSLSITGVPPQAWKKEVFTEVASIWGDILTPEWCPAGAPKKHRGRVVILTSEPRFINETMELVVDKHRFKILLVEDIGDSDKLLPAYITEGHGYVNDSGSEAGDSEESFGDSDLGRNGENAIQETEAEMLPERIMETEGTCSSIQPIEEKEEPQRVHVSGTGPTAHL
ncbi:hypothetical protein LXL04_024591 [Taraxacum kok-saghyz]